MQEKASSASFALLGRTYLQPSLHLDIRTKTNRSQALDDTIEAKRKEVTKLEAKADKKQQDFYTIKERGDWQDPMFFAMTAYIYRIDEGRYVGRIQKFQQGLSR